MFRRSLPEIGNKKPGRRGNTDRENAASPHKGHGHETRESTRRVRATLNEAAQATACAFVKSLRASVQASRPIRVDTAGGESRELFIKRANDRLALADVRRIAENDRRYRDTVGTSG